MEKYIISVPRADFSLDSLLSALHVVRENDLVEEIEAMYLEAVEIAKPKAVYALLSPELRDGEIWLDNFCIQEPFVYKMISANKVVVPYIATCGKEVEEWSRSYTEVYDQFIADSVKQVCLFVIREKLFDEVKSRYFDTECHLSTINPGSLKEWPLSGQIPLFGLLGNVENDIGVTLGESLLMSPTKSVSGIMFPTAEVYHNCQLCPRSDCPNRRSPFKCR